MELEGRTNIGKKRQVNQDAFFIDIVSDTVGIAVVCDGMGGENGGNVASELACETAAAKLRKGYRSKMDLNSIRNLLITAVNAANAAVYARSKEDPGLSGMGTTVVAAIVTPDMAYIAHVGDSRAYIHNKDETVQVTKDHSIVQVLIEQGKLSETDAKYHPQKNLITRAVGVGSSVSVDYIEADLSPGDWVLLCTDGLTNMCTDDEIREILLQYDPGTSCDELVHLANNAGGTDNITVVIAANS